MNGEAIACSGDTAWADTRVQAARGTDLFLHEAYYFDKRVPFHLVYATLRSHRAEPGCKRLVLTHMSADMLGRLGAAEDEDAYDGLTIEL